MFTIPENVNTHEDMVGILSQWSQKLNELQNENQKLKETASNKSDAKGLRKVIQSGSKDLVPKKFTNIAASGSFKAWARELKDYSRVADHDTIEMFKMAEEAQEQIEFGALPMGKEDLDQDMHYLITRFLDGEAKMLSLNAEIGIHGSEHKSGIELWSLLVYN
jgi:hypothetical protein